MVACPPQSQQQEARDEGCWRQKLPIGPYISSSFFGITLYRILNMNHRKELLRSLWVPGVRSPRFHGNHPLELAGLEV